MKAAHVIVVSSVVLAGAIVVLSFATSPRSRVDGIEVELVRDARTSSVTARSAPKPSRASPPDAGTSPATRSNDVTKLRAPEPMALETALVGLAVRQFTEGDRDTLQVPAKWKGVVITRIDPDSPADQIALRVDDVIVRAEETAIASEDDLVRVVGQRDHTLLTISRKGFLFQRVIHRVW